MMRKMIILLIVLSIISFSGCINDNQQGGGSYIQYEAVDSEIILISNNISINITDQNVSLLIDMLNNLGYNTPETETSTLDYITTIYENLGKNDNDHIGGGIYLNGTRWKEDKYDDWERNYTIDRFDTLIIIHTSYINKDNIVVNSDENITQKANSTYQENMNSLIEKNLEIVWILNELFNVNLYKQQYKMRTSEYAD